MPQLSPIKTTTGLLPRRLLGPIMDELRPDRSVLSTVEYLQLLNWTGRQIASGKRGRIAADAPFILYAIDRSP